MSNILTVVLGVVVATAEAAYARRLRVLRLEVGGVSGFVQLFVLLVVPAALVASVAGGLGANLRITAVLLALIVAVPVVLLLRNAWVANEKRAGRRASDT